MSAEVAASKLFEVEVYRLVLPEARGSASNMIFTPTLPKCVIHTCKVIAHPWGDRLSVEMVRVAGLPRDMSRSELTGLARAVSGAMELAHGLRVTHCTADRIMGD
jgi:hypothetical protein